MKDKVRTIYMYTKARLVDEKKSKSKHNKTGTFLRGIFTEINKIHIHMLNVMLSFRLP